jgi:hypothetical protein
MLQEVNPFKMAWADNAAHIRTQPGSACVI